jgi:hypothetical protein
VKAFAIFVVCRLGATAVLIESPLPALTSNGCAKTEAKT